LPCWERHSDAQKRLIPAHYAGKSPKNVMISRSWRRRWDSNPRYAFTAYNGLANRRLQPLGHPSAAAPEYRTATRLIRGGSEEVKPPRFFRYDDRSGRVWPPPRRDDVNQLIFIHVLETQPPRHHAGKFFPASGDQFLLSAALHSAAAAPHLGRKRSQIIRASTTLVSSAVMRLCISGKFRVRVKLCSFI
jgi:hypothetical protein